MVAIALNFLATKISIILEININSSSSADRGKGTSDFKILSEFYEEKLLFVLKLAEQLLCNSRNPERKREKIFTCQWRNRKEKEILEENGQQIKRQVEVIIRELKTGIPWLADEEHSMF